MIIWRHTVRLLEPVPSHSGRISALWDDHPLSADEVNVPVYRWEVSETESLRIHAASLRHPGIQCRPERRPPRWHRVHCATARPKHPRPKSATELKPKRHPISRKERDIRDVRT